MPKARRLVLPESGHCPMLETGISVADWLLWAGIILADQSVMHPATSGSALRALSAGNGAGNILRPEDDDARLVTSAARSSGNGAATTDAIGSAAPASTASAPSVASRPLRAPKTASSSHSSERPPRSAAYQGMLLVLDGMTTVVAYDGQHGPAATTPACPVKASRLDVAAAKRVNCLLRQKQCHRVLVSLRSGVFGRAIALAALRWACHPDSLWSHSLRAAALRMGGTILYSRLDTLHGTASGRHHEHVW
jgi:hypothetical protein